MDNSYQPNGNNPITDESAPVMPNAGFPDQPADKPMEMEPTPSYQQPAPVYQPPVPPYTQTAPVYPQPTVAPVSNTKAIISMICGILGVSCCCGSLIPSIIAIVLAVLDRKDRGGKFSGMGTAGLVCGIVGIAIGLLSFVYWMILMFSGVGVSFFEGYLNEMYYY